MQHFSIRSRTNVFRIVLYNFPGVCNGVDLSSDIITRLAQTHDNIVGVKLTCGSVAKIVRLAAALPPSRFATFGGQSDFIIGGLSSGSVGCIAAFANVFPKTIVKVYDLYRQGRHDEALRIHQTCALAEQQIKEGIGATKYAAAIRSATYAGIKDAEKRLQPRTPYTPLSETAKVTIRKGTEECAKIEEGLPLRGSGRFGPISSRL
jgi:dihydrodipicolinate synthase/N-acetylneuraminate lyase